MDTQKLFGKRIKELRKQNNLTQEQLSELLGVFPKQIGNIETGTTFTTMINLEKLAQVFNVEIKDLFTFTHHQNRKEILKSIELILKDVPDEKLKMIYRIIKEIAH